MSQNETELSKASRKGQSKSQSNGQSLPRVFASVLASLFGVRSGRKREEDFSQGNPWVYVAVGIFVTVIFIVTVWMVVRLVLKSAGV